MIDKDQWQQIEEELKGFFCSVKLKLGEHELQLTREPTGEGRQDLVVFIDGTISFGWGWPSEKSFNPLVQQIWRKRTKAVYTAKEKAEFINIFGKREAKKRVPNLEAKHKRYEPIFLSASSLVRQFKKLKELELVSIGYQAEQEAS